MSENPLPPAIFLMGPTASGKTALAVDLVHHLPCDIISVDSALVYRGMDIGTAKPGPEVLEIAPHRLLDIRDPADAYSAAAFREDALREMAEITAAGRIPLLVGGTGLYFRALEFGFSELPPADDDIRKALDAEAQATGWDAMHARLATVDPQSAERLHPNDTQRIQRALEIYAITGEPMSALLGNKPALALPYRVLKIVLAPQDRSVLHERISTRFASMLQEGLVDEVRCLYERGDLTIELPSVRCVGYRQVWSMLAGEFDEDEMVRRAEAATRQFAKRQFTWLRSEQQCEWFDSEDGQTVGRVYEHLAAFGVA